jgi:hypothetical protein
MARQVVTAMCNEDYAFLWIGVDSAHAVVDPQPGPVGELRPRSDLVRVQRAVVVRHVKHRAVERPGRNVGPSRVGAGARVARSRSGTDEICGAAPVLSGETARAAAASAASASRVATRFARARGRNDGAIVAAVRPGAGDRAAAAAQQESDPDHRPRRDASRNVLEHWCLLT